MAAQIKNNPTSRLSIGCLVVGVLSFFIYFQSCQRTENKTGSSSEAWYIAKQFALKDLKTPATTDFPALHADGVTVTDLGDNKYSVSGFVDAENSFGARVRQHFIVEVQKLPNGDKWSSGGVVWLK